MGNMSRLVLLVAGLFILTAGCQSLGVPSSDPTPRPVPEPPDPVTNQTARAYVTTAERAHIWNRNLGGSSQPTELDLSCHPQVLDVRNSARVVWVRCSGGVIYEELHTDMVTRALYWVERGRTRRVSSRDVAQVSSRVQKGSAVTVYNLDESVHDVRINATFVGNSASLTARYEFRILPEEGIRKEGIPYDDADTTYRVTVTLVRSDGIAHDPDDSISYRWHPGRQVADRRVIFVTPDGDLELLTRPSPHSRPETQ